MTISPQHVVRLHYVLCDSAEQVLDDSRRREAPLEYLHGHANILPGLEAALAGLCGGDTRDIHLAPEEAYGAHEPDLVQTVARTAFPGVETLSPGMRFQAQGPDGPRTVTLVEADDTQVTVDANHPLAGQSLVFRVDILDVRPARRAELAKGHPLAADVEASEVEDRKQ
ncbi:FKBP-type peptidyl-prolyl cis-trans isomerase SlyD [Chromohalobacter marismortui]|uniref:Peptidyl-prolyl cis-trans isomerase n=1 Tax=Chromohalobacter marismortui TaxID=42055 RepID=A0A4V3F3V7_9GAMM|nr:MULTISPECIES: peptidylprolyl isomerase [Chromohalobacter]MCI0508476.1 peptidylprolyl isomerase [Chromohalobacter sp.]MCI0592233.1 peptidylprolyl isomerase [Chromohalobacter sp.]TDU22956.1 FKBP-type peptidyl-prolyl cis-trans isomerase SlyD [Chromohalobacter marismortui]